MQGKIDVSIHGLRGFTWFPLEKVPEGDIHGYYFMPECRKAPMDVQVIVREDSTIYYFSHIKLFIDHMHCKKNDWKEEAEILLRECSSLVEFKSKIAEYEPGNKITEYNRELSFVLGKMAKYIEKYDALRIQFTVWNRG
jgi:hypothetical protein